MDGVSGRQRSYRTAEIAFAGRDLPVRRDARIRECDYGAWTRRPAAESLPTFAPHRSAHAGRRILWKLDGFFVRT